MNDIVAEMFRQAGGHIRIVDGAKWTYCDEGFNYEKFAELIVMECADIATINQHQPMSPGSYVRKHFGVE